MLKDFEDDEEMVSRPTTTDAGPANIGEEFELALETGKISSRLAQLKRALEALPASSIECERSFSTVARYHSKLRNRLNDESLDSMSFARHYYKNLNKKK